MYCSNCGVELAEDSNFCPKCGKAAAIIKEENEVCTNKKAQLIGYSDKINDPAFKKYLKASKNWVIIFTAIIAVAAVIGFPIYGETSGEVEWPYSLYYGLIIGGMFVLIALGQLISKAKDATWDGVVVDKKVSKKKRWDKNSDRYEEYTVYEYYVKRDSGKVYYHRNENDDTVYNYYNVGDRVRHHKGFYSYEKYDKSKDTFIFCTACASINDMTEDICARCKCPLLK